MRIHSKETLDARKIFSSTDFTVFISLLSLKSVISVIFSLILYCLAMVLMLNNMAASNKLKLIVKNFPPELSDEDKKNLMKSFGAADVVCFGKKGKMVCNFMVHRAKYRPNQFQ